MNQNFLGFFLLSVAILGGISLYSKHLDITQLNLNVKNSTHGKLNKKKLKLNQVWKKDIQRLIESSEIPQAWNMINKVIFIPTDPATQKLSKRLIAPVKVNTQGIYRLEVSIISHKSDNDQTQILLQHNLVDSENENTIWELNRTYNLKD